jgi:CRISPR-associated protein Cas1
MTALFIDRKDARLAVNGASLTIHAGGEISHLPLGQIERVVVRGPATIETGLLSRLWTQGVGLLLLSGRRGEPTARFHGQPHNDVRRRIVQTLTACDPAAALVVAKAIVGAKLTAQERGLARLLRRRPGMRRDYLVFDRALTGLRQTLPTATDLDAVRGHEGVAARLYWTAFTGAFAPSLNFTGRNRRPPRDPVNAALSLAYTIATFEAGKQAQSVGLDPMIGFLHAPSFGRESLACDLVEPLRPRIDGWIEDLFRERMIRREHFTADSDGACLLGKAGRAAFYDALGGVLPLWTRWLGRSAKLLTLALDGAAAPTWSAGEEPEP